MPRMSDKIWVNLKRRTGVDRNQISKYYKKVSCAILPHLSFGAKLPVLYIVEYTKHPTIIFCFVRYNQDIETKSNKKSSAVSPSYTG